MSREFRPKSRAQQEIEAATGEPIDVTLRRLYLDDGLSQDAIAVKLNRDRATIQRWMRDYGIATRYLGRGSRKAVA